jgi:hypothetical protein
MRRRAKMTRGGQPSLSEMPSISTGRSRAAGGALLDPAFAPLGLRGSSEQADAIAGRSSTTATTTRRVRRLTANLRRTRLEEVPDDEQEKGARGAHEEQHREHIDAGHPGSRRGPEKVSPTIAISPAVHRATALWVRWHDGGSGS